MFKKLEDISAKNLLKSSIQKSIRAKLSETFPKLPVDELIPKKQSLSVVKLSNHSTIVCSADGTPLVFQIRDGPWVPTLRILMKLRRDCMQTVQCDYGAIKFVLRGSNVMCPGLTSAGGHIDESISKGTVVQIVGEGKQAPCAVGIMTMDGAEVLSVNKGVCIETLHCLGDALWEVAEL